MSIEVFTSMIGVTMSDIAANQGNDEMIFFGEDGSLFRFSHRQACCENVYIQDICGDLLDLVDSPIIEAEQVNGEEPDETPSDTSYTWTFYRFSTAKGAVTVRWLGTSSGYYSEKVSYEENLIA